MTVYRKLIDARQRFLELGNKKSGKNMALAFKYFELADIVPAVTAVFQQVGLVGICNYEEEEGTLTIVDVDDPTQQIVFRTPMRWLDTNKGTNPLQALGSTHTYIRRYLYFQAMDIVEADAVEASLTTNPDEPAPAPAPVPVAEEKPKKSKKPATKQERQEIKKELTKQDAPASEMQINGIKNAISALMDYDPDYIGEFEAEIMQQTNGLTNISAEQATLLIKGMQDMLSEYEKGANNG